MEPGPRQEVVRIPLGCLLVFGGFLVGLVVGAIIGSAHTSPDDFLAGLTVLVFALFGAGLGVAAALLAASLWSLARWFVKRRQRNDDASEPGHGRKSD
jgi:hypothetical protein